MAVKLTKNELKTQKDQLKQFERYLPTLQLKKQQLQLVIRQIFAELDEKSKERKRMIGNLDDWVAVFAENTLFEDSKKIETLVVPKSVESREENIAGVQIPVFENLTFEDIEYEVEDYPLWVDTAIVKLREIARLDALVKVLQKRADLLQKELQTTSQRVNLFEKVKIPQAKENIRVIGIYLGDQQTSAVVRGKIAKKKLQGAGA
jgi:V/A-type H+-transporting ATPase subunit D